jgi:multidrug resistance efflux pump
MNRTEPPRWEELENALLPAEALPETLEAQLVRPSTAGVWLFWGLAAGVLAAIAWIAVAELEITVRCRGYIRPSVPAQTLRSPMDGVVDSVFVRLHHVVQRGDTLLRLRDRELLLQLQTLQEELKHEERLMSDLTVLLRVLSTGSTPSQLAAQLPAPARWQTATVRSLAELIRRDLQLLARQMEALTKRWERTAALYEKQFVSAEEYEAALNELRLHELRMLQYVQSRREGLSQQIDATEHRLQELRQRLGSVQEQLRNTVILANITGQISELFVSQAGAYVAAGQPLVTISPDMQLQAELLVAPQDITLIQPGQRVRYTVVGLPPGQWEPLWGRVESVAEDVTAEGNTLAYRVRASLDSTTVRARLHHADTLSIRLRKGLPVEAVISIGRKPLVSWLLDRSRYVLHRATP